MTVRSVMIGLVFGAVVPALAAAQTTTTTTTTLPGGCVAAVSFSSLTCQTEALAARLQGATDLGRTKATLMKQVAKLDADLRDGEAQMAAGNSKKASERVKKAGRVLIAIGFRLRSLTGRKQIAATTRADLQMTVLGLTTDVKALQKSL
jgi:hypothetical protein